MAKILGLVSANADDEAYIVDTRTSSRESVRVHAWQIVEADDGQTFARPVTAQRLGEYEALLVRNGDWWVSGDGTAIDSRNNADAGLAIDMLLKKAGAR